MYVYMAAVKIITLVITFLKICFMIEILMTHFLLDNCLQLKIIVAIARNRFLVSSYWN